MKQLKERGKRSKVYSPHQFTGLQVAEILHDETHKSLYIKLAKKHGADILLGLARSVADRRNVKNKGAYFMKLLKEHGKDTNDRRSE